MRWMFSLVMTWLAFVLLAGTAHADDYYVDPVAGDDGNTGLAPGDAWRTVTHALWTVSADNVVHLAPGIYHRDNGEDWPLPITGVQIVGAGSEETVLWGGWFKSYGGSAWYRLNLSGVTLRRGKMGIYVWRYHAYKTVIRLSDVQILETDEAGIDVDSWGNDYGDAYCALRLDRVRVSRCGGDGIHALASAAFSTGDAELDFRAADLEITDCGGAGLNLAAGPDVVSGRVSLVGGRVMRCAGGGALIDASPNSPEIGPGSVELTRCAFLDCGGDGLRFVSNDAVVRDSLFARNGGHGVAPGAGATLDRCTSVDNQLAGIAPGFNLPDVWSSILAGNLVPIDPAFGTVNAEYTCTDVGPPLPGPGNFVADPLLRDSAGLDYRLAFGSPCIDAARPGVPADALDLDGRARDLDGDLDTIGHADLGAYELATLSLAGEPRVGATVTLELWGPSDGNARVFFAAAPLVDPTLPTPFGELALDRATLVVLGTIATAPAPPGEMPVAIPDDASLVGQTWSFQALSGTGGPAPPNALTNALSFVILP